MSGLLNKLTGHHNADHTTNTHEHGSHGSSHNNVAGQTTTTQTQTTTNNALPNQSLNQQATLGGLQNQNAVATNAPYGATNATSTQRTGAAYTDATGVNNNQAFNQQRGVTGDDAITRSEEQLRLAKARVETGTAQLNKYVSVDHVEKQIPIGRERLVIERFPINEMNMGTFAANAVIGEQHFVTTVTEDRIAAMKEIVPIERIRLAKEVEGRVENVSADLRKEHVDYVYQPLAAGAKNDDGLAHDAQARHDFAYETARKTDSSFSAAGEHDRARGSGVDSHLPGHSGKSSGMHSSGENFLSDKIDNVGRSGLGHSAGTGLMGQNSLATGTGHA